MSKEVEEAIEILNGDIKGYYISQKQNGISEKYEIAIETVLNYIKNLEEKNKKLYETCCRYEETLGKYECEIFEELDDYIKLEKLKELDRIGIKGKKYISESKIRDKIEEYQENMKKYEYADRNIFNENNIRQEVITVLNGLLEEE